MTDDLPNANHTLDISDAHLNIALSQVSIGFWEVSLTNHNFMACTRQCKENFGWSPSAPFSYSDMLSCILPEDLPNMLNMVNVAIREKQPYLAQYRVRHSDGRIRWI